MKIAIRLNESEFLGGHAYAIYEVTEHEGEVFSHLVTLEGVHDDTNQLRDLGALLLETIEVKEGTIERLCGEAPELMESTDLFEAGPGGTVEGEDPEN